MTATSQKLAHMRILPCYQPIHQIAGNYDTHWSNIYQIHALLSFYPCAAINLVHWLMQTSVDKTGQIHLRFSLPLWAMAYGHSSGLPPLEAPVMIPEKA